MTNGCAGFSVQGESGALLALIYFTTRVRKFGYVWVEVLMVVLSVRV